MRVLQRPWSFNLSGLANPLLLTHTEGEAPLDYAFALIEGHPPAARRQRICVLFSSDVQRV